MTDSESYTKDGKRCYAKDNAEKHGGDDPCGAVGGARRGVGDAHGVDECVRDEEQELHAFLMLVRLNSSRNWMFWRVSGESWRGCEASVEVAIAGLPPGEWGHTLK